MRTVTAIPSSINDIVARYVKAKDLEAAQTTANHETRAPRKYTTDAEDKRPVVVLPPKEAKAQKLEQALDELVDITNRFSSLDELSEIRIAVGNYAKKVAEWKRKNLKKAA